MKELIDLIRPDFVIQLRSSNPYFRHIMPNIDSQWSSSAPISKPYREIHHIPMSSLYDQYEYHLMLTPVRQHNQHGKSSLTRQACLWSYFSQIEMKQLVMRPLIDYSDRVVIFNFQRIAIGILHKKVQAKYLLQVLNASIVALCRVAQDMVCQLMFSPSFLICEDASLWLDRISGGYLFESTFAHSFRYRAMMIA